jgi:hypothetical protein
LDFLEDELDYHYRYVEKIDSDELWEFLNGD